MSKWFVFIVLKNEQQNKIDEISMQIVHVMTSRCFALQKKGEKRRKKKRKKNLNRIQLKPCLKVRVSLSNIK